MQRWQAFRGCRSLNDGSLKPEPLISEVIPLADMFSAMRDRSLQENEAKEFAPCTGTARFRGAVARQNNNVKHDQRKKSQNKHIQHYGANLRLRLQSRNDQPWHRAMTRHLQLSSSKKYTPSTVTLTPLEASVSPQLGQFKVGIIKHFLGE